MAEFHPLTEQQWRLRRWLHTTLGFSTVESVVSGPGLVNTYRFLLDDETPAQQQDADGTSGEAKQDAAAAEAEAEAAVEAAFTGMTTTTTTTPSKKSVLQGVLRGVPKSKRPAAVATAALEGSDPVCSAALDLWIECLASHLRLTACHLLCTGGLYICGGIPPKILPRIQAKLSPGLFTQDPVMGEFIRDNIPLHLIKNDDVGLLGARIRAEMLLREPQ